jgi:hypothetical protein
LVKKSKNNCQKRKDFFESSFFILMIVKIFIPMISKVQANMSFIHEQSQMFFACMGFMGSGMPYFFTTTITG